MNQKQVLAIILFLVIIASSHIVGKNNDILMVKDVSSNVDKYMIENIKENTDSKNINIFYPVTKYENINKKIKDKIDYYKHKFETAEFASETKVLDISFEEYEYKEYTSFRFNVKSNTGIFHDLEEVFTIVYKDNQVIDIEYLKSKEPNFLDILYEECSQSLKNNSKVKSYSTKEWLEQGLEKNNENYSNYLFTENGFIVIFNTYTIAPYVAGIIEVEIPYSKFNTIFDI